MTTWTDTSDHSDLSPALVLNAYARGIFPMAEARDDEGLFWLDPDKRGVIPLDGLHISRSLRKLILRAPYRVTIDTAFTATVEGCADRDETWINRPIFDIYRELHALGHAHSLELWDGPDLIGGIYGITLQSAFFGESMFSRRASASKIALAYLVAVLRRAGFKLFDTQFITPHLASMGGIEISRAQYRAQLKDALSDVATAPHPPDPLHHHPDLRQILSQLSPTQVCTA